MTDTPTPAAGPTRNVRLTGLFTLRSPLSHIGEAISTNTYLVQEPILQPDGQTEEVAVYNGNAWRGQLRDLAAEYMLQRLGNAAVPLEAFHLLFSGGKIGGDMGSLDVGKMRRTRAAVPMVSLFGGGVANMIMPGKLRVSNAYPLCQEAIPALPESLHADADRVSYRGLTVEKSFSRVDNAKNPRYQPYIQSAAELLDGPAESKGKTKRDGPADQMRMTSELLIAGVRLYTSIDCLDVTEVELGCLTSALHAFSISPHIGGQANKGHGRVTLAYNLMDLATGDEQPFLRITDGPALLAPPAEAAKAAYDQHLRSLYDAMLADQGGEIRALLGAA